VNPEFASGVQILFLNSKKVLGFQRSMLRQETALIYQCFQLPEILFFLLQPSCTGAQCSTGTLSHTPAIVLQRIATDCTAVLYRHASAIMESVSSRLQKSVSRSFHASDCISSIDTWWDI
jgi:hypothetical protein